MGAEALVAITHPSCLRHVPPPGHPERPARLSACNKALARLGVAAVIPPVDEGEVLEAITCLHDPRLPQRLAAAAAAAPTFLDTGDNPVSEGTFEAAIAATGCVLAGLEALARGDARWVFVSVRPPGHHATRDQAMGFCFFNNVAVAAQKACDRGLGPVAVVDFDVHHGNGTQELFYHRSDVFYLSVHRYPFYPGTGGADEVGAGAGFGYTRNIPLSEGADDRTYLAALTMGLEELTARLSPRLWLVSAGFDASELDPLGGMSVTSNGFGQIGSLIRQAAGEAPVLAVLEGGYHLQALEEGLVAFLRGLLGAAS